MRPGRARRRRTRRRVLVGAAALLVVVAVAVVAWQVIGGSDDHELRAGAQPTTTTTAETAPACAPLDAISTWPIERRLAQLLMVGVDPANGDDAREVVSQGVGGIFIGGDATTIFTDGTLTQLPSLAKVAPFVAVDEEGGRVQRVDALYGSIPSARTMAATMTPEAVQALAATRAQRMREAGITMDLAPVVDVSNQSNGEVIGDRSFSDDPQTVVTFARAFADGLRSAGVIPVLKHFPGHGHANGDSHHQTAVTPPIAQLQTSDLVPYTQLLAGAQPPGVMVGHLDVPGLTNPDEPTSVSGPTITGLLRQQLGFQGLVMTDDLAGMVAITERFDLPHAVLAALNAGADMPLWVATGELGKVLSFLVESVAGGQLQESAVNASVERVLAAKGVDPCA